MDKRNRCINVINNNMTTITFLNFWQKYHYIVKLPKLNKAISKRLWDKTISLESKRNAFNNITKEIKIGAYEYLLRELKNY